MAHTDQGKLNQIRTKHARWAGGLGLITVFIPMLDMGLIATVWTSMLIQIAEASGHHVDKRYAKKFAGSVVKGTLFYLAGSRIGTWLVSMTGVGAPGAMAANAGLNYGYTWLMGGFLIEQFSRPEVDMSGLVKSAIAYLLSFGLSEVSHIQDLHDATTTLAQAHEVAASAVDAHHAAATVMDAHHAVTSAVDANHAATTAIDAQHAFGTAYSIPDHVTHAIRFTGLDHTELIAGFQESHPWCGVHSLGNLVQMFQPSVGEQVNDLILNLAGTHGGLIATGGDYALNLHHFQPILNDVFHIPAHWEATEIQRIANLVRENHGVLAVGDAQCLNPSMYPAPNSWHAFNITDVKVDDQGMTWFKGLDSNLLGQETWWSGSAVEAALERGRGVYGVNTLITDNPVIWPWKH